MTVAIQTFADDFTLQIESDGRGGLRIRGRGLARAIRAEFRWPFGERRLDWNPAAVEAAVVRSGVARPAAERRRNELRVERVGEALFEALLAGHLQAALAEAQQGGSRVVRLRLVFDLKDPAVAEVAVLPWELLRDPRLDTFLARKPNTPIVRCLEVPRRRVWVRDEGSLRVLLAAAQPPGSRKLDLDQEAVWIQQALGDEVEIHTLPHCTPEDLRRAVRQHRIDVLHLMGHGGFDPRGGHGVLVLEDPEGGSARLSGRTLAALLADAPGLRLVVLNSCDTARFERHEGRDPYTGVAGALVQSGIPEVVAMQYPISDQAARAFSRAFYQGIAQGVSPEQAVAEGRLAISMRNESLEWATPVLFSSLSAREDSGVFQPLYHPRRGRAKVLAAGGMIAFLALLLWIFQDRRDGLPHVPEDPRCPSPAGLDLDLVYIEEGSFQMGSDSGEKWERPAHPQEVEEGYCIGAFEVTQGLWRAVMGEEGEGPILGDERFLPQLGIRWSEAQYFVRRLNERVEGDPFRLPTEVEWEYAARAGSATVYSFGDAAEELPLYGNCDTGDTFDNLAAPVGSFAPNAWGLYDVHGNVWEWTADAFCAYPGGGWLPDRPRWVRRGGSFGSVEGTCRVAKRSGILDQRDPESGLRIVRRAESR